MLITAYVNLPHNSLGAIKGWFTSTELAQSHWRCSFSSDDSDSSHHEHTKTDVDSKDFSENGFGMPEFPVKENRKDKLPPFVVDKDYELNEQILEPFSYRKREADEFLELRANCFTMQTHVIMFNFAWYVYYYGTPKVDTLSMRDNPLPFRFSIADSIRDMSTDTSALVIDGHDRIIVTFKGTTSMRNLQTSIKVFHERLVNVVPTNFDNRSELTRLRTIFGRSYEAAKIHRGFSAAYASVAPRVMQRIKMLLERKRRPVFLTGHSLGGALATICSLDVWIKLKVSRREIFVSTFGSPRVGNLAFRKIYDSVIPLHWRIVVNPDMVAKLPKVGYHHVGKKVLLTAHGEMFIDPNALEWQLWSGNTAGLSYHRKASYLLAMREWCMRQHGKTYTPVFWPFPVREEDYKRFPGQSQQEDNPLATTENAARIVMMDAMVDALGRERNNSASDEVVERWGRMTRRLFLNDRLNRGRRMTNAEYL